MASPSPLPEGLESKKEPVKDHAFFFVVASAVATGAVVWTVAMNIKVEPLKERLTDTREKLASAETDLKESKVEIKEARMRLTEQEAATREQANRLNQLTKDYEDCRRPPPPRWVPRSDQQQRSVVVGHCEGRKPTEIRCTPETRGREILETSPALSSGPGQAEYKDLRDAFAQGFEVQLADDGTTAHVIGGVECRDDRWESVPVTVYRCE